MFKNEGNSPKSRGGKRKVAKLNFDHRKSLAIEMSQQIMIQNELQNFQDYFSNYGGCGDDKNSYEGLSDQDYSPKYSPKKATNQNKSCFDF